MGLLPVILVALCIALIHCQGRKVGWVTVSAMIGQWMRPTIRTPSVKECRFLPIREMGKAIPSVSGNVDFKLARNLRFTCYSLLPQWLYGNIDTGMEQSKRGLHMLNERIQQ